MVARTLVAPIWIDVVQPRLYEVSRVKYARGLVPGHPTLYPTCPLPVMEFTPLNISAPALLRASFRDGREKDAGRGLRIDIGEWGGDRIMDGDVGEINSVLPLDVSK